MSDTDERITGIEAVIFDLGGVIIDLNRDASVAALQSIGLTDADKLLDPYVQRGPFLDLETGRITAGRFYDDMRAAIGRPDVKDEEIQEAFNCFLVRLPEERLRALRALREKGFRIYALSNTNPVMFHSWIANAFRAEGLAINDYFDGVVASFQEGMCKPDAGIFELTRRRYRLDPERTLMLDDAPANVEAARSVGFRAIRVGYTPQDDVLAIISRLEAPQK